MIETHPGLQALDVLSKSIQTLEWVFQWSSTNNHADVVRKVLESECLKISHDQNVDQKGNSQNMPDDVSEVIKNYEKEKRVTFRFSTNSTAEPTSPLSEIQNQNFIREVNPQELEYIQLSIEQRTQELDNIENSIKERTQELEELTRTIRVRPSGASNETLSFNVGTPTSIMGQTPRSVSASPNSDRSRESLDQNHWYKAGVKTKIANQLNRSRRTTPRKIPEEDSNEKENPINDQFDGIPLQHSESVAYQPTDLKKQTTASQRKPGVSPFARRSVVSPVTAQPIAFFDARKSNISPGARKTVGSPDSRRSGLSPASKQPIAFHGVVQSTLSPGTRKSVGSPDSRKYGISPSTRQPIAFPDTRRSYVSPGGRKAVESPESRRSLCISGSRKSAASPETRKSTFARKSTRSPETRNSFVTIESEEESISPEDTPREESPSKKKPEDREIAKQDAYDDRISNYMISGLQIQRAHNILQNPNQGASLAARAKAGWNIIKSNMTRRTIPPHERPERESVILTPNSKTQTLDDHDFHAHLPMPIDNLKKHITEIHDAIHSNDHVKYANLLLTTDTDLNLELSPGRTQVHHIARNGTGILIAILAKIIKCKNKSSHYADDNSIEWNLVDEKGDTPLLAAVKSGNIDSANGLVEIHDVDVNKVDINGDTPLHVAIKEEQSDIVESLLTHPEIEVNKVDKENLSPLYRAVLLCTEEHNNHLHKVIDLLTEDERTDCFVSTNDGWTVMHHSVYKGLIFVFHQLVNIRRLQVNSPGRRSNESLSSTSSRSTSDEDAPRRSRRGLSIGEKLAIMPDIHGRSPLAVAIRAEQSLCVELLLAMPHVEVNSPSHNGGVTPLHEAIAGGNVSLVKMILRYNSLNADPSRQVDINAADEEGRTPLHYAVRNNSLKMVTTLLECSSIDVNIMSKKGSCLHEAVHRNVATVIAERLVLRADLNVTAENSLGQTALGLAAVQGNEELIYVILERPGVDLCNELAQTDKEDRTPLMAAAKNNQLECAKLLIQQGSEFGHLKQIEDKEAQAVIQFAMEQLGMLTSSSDRDTDEDYDTEITEEETNARSLEESTEDPSPGCCSVPCCFGKRKDAIPLDAKSQLEPKYVVETKTEDAWDNLYEPTPPRRQSEPVIADAPLNQNIVERRTSSR